MSRCPDRLRRGQEDQLSSESYGLDRRDGRVCCAVSSLTLECRWTDNFRSEAERDLQGSAPGYTKAVDMWSLGCIAAILLTGASAFTDPVTRTFSETLAREANLDALHTSREWLAVRERPKDFVDKLLLLEEHKRMTAQQALKHEWFSNDFHRADFEELYKRTIKHWVARPARTDLIKFMGAGRLRRIAESEGVLEGKRAGSFSGATKAGKAIEAHMQPFPRQMHTALWPPKRPHPGYISPTTKAVIQESWPSPHSLDARLDDDAQPKSKRRRTTSAAVEVSPTKTLRKGPGLKSKVLPKSPVLPSTPQRTGKTLSNTSMPLRPADPGTQRNVKRADTTAPWMVASVAKNMPSPRTLAEDDLESPLKLDSGSRSAPGLKRMSSFRGVSLELESPSKAPNSSLKRRPLSTLQGFHSPHSHTDTPSRTRRGSSIFELFDDDTRDCPMQSTEASPSTFRARRHVDDDEDFTEAHHTSALPEGMNATSM
jgi:serine/threonine protein kinase